MMFETMDTLVIGAGLSGIYAASLLTQTNRSFVILEVRDLGLTGYPQYDTGHGRFQAVDGHARTIPGYPMEPEGWRISGGMITLVNGLYQHLPEGVVRVSHPVCEIERMTDHVEVRAGKTVRAVRPGVQPARNGPSRGSYDL